LVRLDEEGDAGQICHMHLVREGWAEEPETSRLKGVDLARQALQVAENDLSILANAASVLALFGEDIGAMIGLVDRALALNTSFARGWFVSGYERDVLLALFESPPCDVVGFGALELHADP
jgi:hypothetical protein